MLRLLTLICCLTFTLSGTAQHTLSYDSTAGPGRALLAYAAWLQGTWVGSGLGMQVEESWSLPQHDAMMGMFRGSSAQGVAFYEFWLLRQEGETLVLRLKHFNPDLKGWEEKDGMLSFRLVKAEPNALYFSGLTYRLVAQDRLEVWLRMKNKDGTRREELFAFTRQR